MQIATTAPTPTPDPIPAFAPVESPLACGIGVSVGDNVDVVVGLVCEELEEDVEEDAEEELREVLVVEVWPIVSGILIAAVVSQQSVFACPQHQVVAVEAFPQGVIAALPLVS